MKKPYAWLIPLILSSGCSSTNDFTLYKHLMAPETVKRSPDLSLYPDLLRRLPIKDKVSVSWAGLISETSTFPTDKQGRLVLSMKQHYLAVDAVAIRKDPTNIKFQISEASGGNFECRIPFREPPPAKDWEEFKAQKKAIGCTGKIVGYNAKGHPIIQATLLEGFRIESVENFVPKVDKNQRVVLDDHGRPSFEYPRPEDPFEKPEVTPAPRKQAQVKKKRQG